MDKTTILTLVALVFVTIAITEQQPAKAQTTAPTINFTQLFKQKFTGLSVTDVTVVYQSPATVFLEGNAISPILESNEDDNKESKEPDYDDDEKSDKDGGEKQEHDTGEITVNQVF